MKLTTTNQPLAEQPKKYCRLVVTEERAGTHRLVETSNGHLEYRLGVGKYKDVTPRQFRTLLRTIVQAGKGHQVEHLAIELSRSPFPQLEPLGDAWVVRTMAENLLLAAYEFTTYKSKGKGKALKEVRICGGMNAAEQRAFKTGETVATAMNHARDIVNTPACDMTPTQLAAAAKTAVKGTKATVKVLGLPEIKKLKMGALMAVGQGSLHQPKFIVIEYFGAGKGKGKPVVLAGKGITYDTGGLNVKPTGAMHEMHMDMGGGGAVIGAMEAIAKLRLKKNVVALIPTAENAVSDRSMHAGDIITTMSGQTVEVMHTDAEGRLVLADALTYAERYEPKVVLDVATLTGAALVALGQHTSAVMSKDEKLQQQLIALGEESGDLLWPLPLWDEYKQHIKSSRADIANISPNFSKFGGAIEGGTFLSFFATKKAQWAHIDIAPRMTSIPSDKLAKGATGEPVRLLVRFIEQF